ncbi:extracellular solute-binding protein [Azospirillum sp.]|uniref:extracellular solute-binding protein n=1 Tax=Azospirillum sp. TaxID=34012 RepID=UPI003D73BD86
MNNKKTTILALALGLLLTSPVHAQTTKSWGIAEFGQPKYGADLTHWPYANPDAPKGGSIVLGAFGSFDTLNPMIERGSWPSSIGLTGATLMAGSADELVAAYGVVAESAEIPADKSWIAFDLRPEARWHDGTPITAEDFVFAFDFIRKNGRLFLRSFYDDVEGCAAETPRRLKCTMRTRDTMKPLVAIAGLGPVPRHYWIQPGRDLTKTTLEPPVGAGPYRIKHVDPGRSITYERVKDWWAKDLAQMRGLYNIDELRFDYYRDDTVMFEAFMAGRMDFWEENRAQRWATAYTTAAVTEGRIVRRETPDNTPRGVSGYVMNTRRPIFRDIRVRQAINWLYDFETVQRQLLYGQYKRLKSWFPNSEYGASGPPTPEELAILAPYKDKLPPEATAKAFEPPVTDGTGNNRANVREAMRLFKEAGWEVKNGVLTNAKTGQPFAFEILMADPGFVRVTEPFVVALKRVGIDAQIRVVDTAQYKVRTDEYDFDMVNLALNFFAPPGPELRSFFSAKVVDVKGQGNFAGIKDPVAEELMDKIVSGTDLPTIEATTRALDRVLLWGYYIVPLWYNDSDRLAYWDKFGYPRTMGKYSNGFPTTWWLDPARAAALPARR